MDAEAQGAAPGREEVGTTTGPTGPASKGVIIDDKSKALLRLQKVDGHWTKVKKVAAAIGKTIGEKPKVKGAVLATALAKAFLEANNADGVYTVVLSKAEAWLSDKAGVDEATAWAKALLSA
jgi:hypothetical protein